MGTQPESYTFNPGEDQLRKETEEDYKRDGWSFKEIPDPGGSGAITVIFTPPEEAPSTFVASSSSAATDRKVASSVTSSPAGSDPDKLAWGAKVSGEFRRKVRKIAADLGCEPDFLMAAMAFETGEKFSPDIKNKVSGATGLIQFMPNTAITLGTTTADLSQMSAEDQLDFVEKYFHSQKGKLHTLEDVYMAILWPAAVGKPNEHVIFAKPSKAYVQNSGLDLNNDGQVTKAEAAEKVRAKLVKGRLEENCS